MQKRKGPIQTGIEQWLGSEAPSDVAQQPHDVLLKAAPKRFTIYAPMALLPAGSFAGEPWSSILANATAASRHNLWLAILRELSRENKSILTHLAVVQGIPSHKDDESGAENILRSPTGLRMLEGDFGADADVRDDTATAVAQENFERALWVSTKQNGLFQMWAPRWTMFSRGNVKEKARVLSFGGGRSKLGNTWAVDLYAGIGYFVFSYAALGMKVLCWELNPWSVEGLRRGALANKFSVKVIQGPDLERPVRELVDGEEQIVVFLESNERALQRIRDMQVLDLGLAKEIEHVNCGFLPSSEATWNSAWEMTTHSSEAWLHLHENTGVNDIEDRKSAIQAAFSKWAVAEDDDKRTPQVEHVELVKTFAPGVWHCVFDVHITRSRVT